MTLPHFLEVYDEVAVTLTKEYLGKEKKMVCTDENV